MDAVAFYIAIDVDSDVIGSDTFGHRKIAVYRMSGWVWKNLVDIVECGTVVADVDESVVAEVDVIAVAEVDVIVEAEVDVIAGAEADVTVTVVVYGRNDLDFRGRLG